LLSLDPKFSCWFPYESFNQIQQQSLPSILKSDENIIISAPTGSGKTTLFELAMIRLLETHPIKKIVYLSPMRALCTEKFALWSKKLSSIGKSCIELIGGDNHNFTKEQVEEADLYITTPEKWDYMTRSSNFIDSIGLILVKKYLKRFCYNYILD
jgi:ATP-dependent DNA helicase HFM1/MER3